MYNHFIFKDEDDSSSLQIAMLGIYDVKKDTMLDVLMACNKVSKSIKVLRAIINNDSVWLLYK